MPSFIAIASAVLKPMPRISRASLYGFSDMTWMASSRENASRANRPDTVDLAQPIRCGLYDFENLLTKGANEFFGVDRSHAPDHAGRKVFFDAVGRSWRRCAQE